MRQIVEGAGQIPQEALAVSLPVLDPSHPVDPLKELILVRVCLRSPNGTNSSSSSSSTLPIAAVAAVLILLEVAAHHPLVLLIAHTPSKASPSPLVVFRRRPQPSPNG